ncbi:polysaccharide deacetylase family protein [Rummeliibacillus sp. JY-2-4R]
MATLHPRKQISWINFTLISAILTITVLILCILNSQYRSILKGDSNHTALAASSDIVKEKSTFNGIDIVTEKSTDKSAPYSIQYPYTSSKVFNQSVTDTVHTIRDQYLKDMSVLLHKNGSQVGNLTISFKTNVHKKNYYSFVLTQIIDTGIGSKQKIVKTFMYDEKNKKQLLLQDVIQTKDHLAPLSNAAKKQIAQSYDQQRVIKTQDLNDDLKPLWINFQNFTLTDDTLTIYFNNDEFMQQVNLVTIPLSSINSILAKSFQVEEKKIVSNKKVVALTFDDGPNNTVTPKILKILKRHHAKATFFMVGAQVNAHPKIAKQVKDAGHEIGNHSYSHPNLLTLTNKQIKEQIAKTNKAIQKATGRNPTVFRPPYGCVDKRVRSQTSLPVTLWNVDTLDWKHRNAKKILAYVKKETHSGSIILMHDVHMPTADGLDAVLNYLEKEGYTFVTVSELNQTQLK